MHMELKVSNVNQGNETVSCISQATFLSPFPWAGPLMDESVSRADRLSKEEGKKRKFAVAQI